MDPSNTHTRDSFLMMAGYVVVVCSGLATGLLWMMFSGGAEVVRDWLWTWWPLAVLAYVPALAQLVVSVWAEASTARMSAEPLGSSGGAWLRDRIESLGLDSVTVGAGPSPSRDAYMPWSRTILLADRTYTGRTVMAWSIAAHELGHLLVMERHRVWAVLSILSRTALRFISVALPPWLLMATLFGGLWLTVALGLVVAVAVVCNVVVLVDETWASRVAMQQLRQDPRVSHEDWLIGRRVLFRGFSTYLIRFACLYLLLFYWPWIAASLGSVHFVPAPALDVEVARWATVAAGVLTVLGAVWWQAPTDLDADVSQGLRRMWRDLCRAVVTAMFIALTWDQPLGALYVGAIVLAAPQLATLADLMLMPLVAATVMMVLSRMHVDTEVDASDIPRVEIGPSPWTVYAPNHPIWVMPAVILWFVL